MGVWIGLVLGAIAIPIAITGGIGVARKLGRAVVSFMR